MVDPDKISAFLTVGPVETALQPVDFGLRFHEIVLHPIALKADNLGSAAADAFELLDSGFDLQPFDLRHYLDLMLRGCQVLGALGCAEG